MVQRFDMRGNTWPSEDGYLVSYKDYQELEAENARLRQQRDSANAQLDFILQNIGADCGLERDI